MDVQVDELYDGGSDQLIVMGTVDGEPERADGWISALWNHYGPEAYGDDGQLLEDEHGNPLQQARPMTEAERLDYARRLLAEAALARREPEVPGEPLGVSS